MTGETFAFADLGRALADSRTALPAVRTVLGRTSLPEDWRASAANRLLMPDVDISSDELMHLVISRPIDLDDVTWISVLRSHALDGESVNALLHGQVTKFLETRDSALQRVVFRFIGDHAESGFDNSPPLASLNFDENE